MSYDAAKQRVGRQPCYIVELLVDTCSNVYGETPCTASTTDPDEKCYNTRSTCQDPKNFNLGTKSYAFCTDVLKPPNACYPWIPRNGVNITPVATSQTGKIFQNGSVTVRIADPPMHDRKTDIYWNERSVPGEQRSTFWKKWLVRNKYYRGRELKLREGFIREDGRWQDFKTSYWIIDSISVPNNGYVVIKAKDVLKLAWSKNAQAPVGCPFLLATDINGSQQTLDVKPIEGVDVDDYYDTSGYIRIGKEVMAYTRTTHTFTVTRAQRGTPAEAHKSGDTVQECAVFTGTVSDVLYDLLSGYTKISTTYLPKAEWDSEVFSWLQDVSLEAVITEPTGVDKLVSELMLSTQSAIFWDPYLRCVNLVASQPAFEENSTLITDEEILQDSVTFRYDPGQQATQVWVSYDILNASEGLTEMSNFRTTLITVESSAESSLKYDYSQVDHFFSRWYDNGNESAVLATAGKLMNIRVDPPIEMRMKVDISKATVGLGGLWRLKSREFVDASGSPVETPFFVSSMVTKGDYVEYVCTNIAYSGRSGRWMDQDTATEDYSDATSEEKATGMYWCDADDDNLLPNGEEGYRWI